MTVDEEGRPRALEALRLARHEVTESGPLDEVEQVAAELSAGAPSAPTADEPREHQQ